MLFFEGSVTTICGPYSCLPPHERVPSVFDKCFQADVDSRIKDEMKGEGRGAGCDDLPRSGVEMNDKTDG